MDALQCIKTRRAVRSYTGAAVTDEQIRQTVEQDIDGINRNMPKYKHVHRLILQTREMAKTTTGKVKRYEEQEHHQ